MTTNIGKDLLDAIKSKDVQRAKAQVQQFNANMRDATVGADYVIWITEPVNLTEVHKALAEDLEVPPRLLAIRRKLMSRAMRAMILVSAMEKALERVYP
jgi:hypothetical protein